MQFKKVYQILEHNIKTKEDCNRRDGSVWKEGQCWDFTHRIDW